MRLVDGAGMGLFEQLEAERKAVRRQGVVVDTLCSACKGWPEFLVFRCEDCGKTICALCLVDEFGDFPCYCGLEENKEAWSKMAHDALLRARVKVQTCAQLRDLREARDAEREAESQRRIAETKRMLEGRLLCICGHEEKVHFTHHERGCHWSRGQREDYRDCECNAFTLAASTKEEAE